MTTRATARAPAPLRLLLADDHESFRRSLAALLAVAPAITSITQVSSGEEALSSARAHRPDVVLLNADMLGKATVSTLREFVAGHLADRIIMLTVYEDPATTKQLLDGGASACLVKTASHRELLSAVRGGLSAMVPDAAGTWNHASRGNTVLSCRELEVLSCVAKARTNIQISNDLRISASTVKRHLSNINVKLGATSRIDALRRATRQGLLVASPED